jgi:hypothetical protein
MLSRLALVTIAGGALVVTSACSTNVSELEKLELHDSLFAGLAPALVENQLRLRNSGLSPTTAADTISLILPRHRISTCHRRHHRVLRSRRIRIRLTCGSKPRKSTKYDCS